MSEKPVKFKRFLNGRVIPRSQGAMNLPQRARTAQKARTAQRGGLRFSDRLRPPRRRRYIDGNTELLAWGSWARCPCHGKPRTGSFSRASLRLRDFVLSSSSLPQLGAGPRLRHYARHPPSLCCRWRDWAFLRWTLLDDAVKQIPCHLMLRVQFQ